MRQHPTNGNTLPTIERPLELQHYLCPQCGIFVKPKEADLFPRECLKGKD